MDVKLVKLVNGDEFIAEEAQSINIKIAEFKNPIVLQPTQQGIHMIPYPFFRKNPELTLKEEHILFRVSIADEIVNEYKKQFGGIIEPSKSLIL